MAHPGVVRLVAAIVLAVVVVTGCVGDGAGARTAVPALRYSVFLAHMLVAQEQLEGQLTTLTDAGTGSAPGMSADDVRRVGEAIAATVADERAWLADNPPADCYRDAHALAGVLADSLAEVAEAVQGWADAMVIDDGAAAAEAFASFTATGQSALGDAEDLQTELDAVTCLD